jgi:hypothetical protein
MKGLFGGEQATLCRIYLSREFLSRIANAL